MPNTKSIEDQKTFEMAMGRIFRLGSRPSQPGDVAEYERCREIIMNLAGPQTPDYTPNFARDRRNGAAGD